MAHRSQACRAGRALCVALGIVVAAQLEAATRFVKSDAGGANDGTSWANAFTSLQSAITAAVSGDEIWVAAGTYKPTNTTDRTIYFLLKDGVSMYGGFAGTESLLTERDPRVHVTILSGEIGAAGTGDNSYHVVRRPGAVTTPPVLDGFTVTAGAAHGSGDDLFGGGLLLSGTATIRDCIVSGNSANYGGGMWINAGNSVVTGCIFRNNSAVQDGSAIGLISGGTATFTNCLIYSNTSNFAAVAGFTGGTPFVNCTVVNNTANTNTGGVYGGTLTNCIVRGNAVAQVNNSTVTYSNIEGGFSGAGNIDADPLFRNAASGDYRLKPSSPSIDAGNNAAVPGSITTDLAGIARFLDDPAVTDTGSGSPPIVDMGAYERLAASSYTLNVAKSGTGTGTVASDPAGIDCGATCSASFADGTIVTLTATPDEGYAFSRWSGACSGRGPCSVTMTASETAVAHFGDVRYVDHDAAGANDGTSWADAYTSLQTALTNASEGTELWVAAGTYKPTTGSDRTLSFVMKSGVAVMGGFAGTETLLSQRNAAANPTILSGAIGTSATTDNSYHVVTDAGADDLALLDGFTITAGNANSGSGFPDNIGGAFYFTGNAAIANCIITGNLASQGAAGFAFTGNHTFTGSSFQFNVSSTSFAPAGVLVSSGTNTFTNCTFNANSAPSGLGGGAYAAGGTTTFRNCRFLNHSGMSQGGGLYLGGGTNRVIDCTFAGNSATSGGAIVTGGTTQIVNSLFTGNRATSAGGAIFFNGTTTVINSTFKNNTADSCGLFASNSAPTITNSVIWGNTGALYCGPAPAITYSDVEGGFGGTGNINADPLFVNPAYPGDGHLGTNSPAIDAGNNAAVPADITTDLTEVEPRFLDTPTVADTGAGTPPIVDMGAYEFCDPPTGVNLSVAIIGGGTGTTFSDPAGISCPLVCSANFALSTVVTLSAVADAGSTFAGWSGACSGTGDCVVTMSAAKSVFARFDRLRYVKWDAAGANDGSSWNDAYTSLATALSNATNGTELWVAGGTYTPGLARSSTFTITNGVAVYGGFGGTETARDERSTVDHPTTLSGEIGASGIADNTYHVVTFNSSSTLTSILDGFVVTGGNADGGGIDQYGGGIVSFGASQIRNCLIAGNSGSGGGGMILTYSGGSPPSPKVINTAFVGNTATSQFGSALIASSIPVLINCSMTGNRAPAGYAVYFGGPPGSTIANSILWNNAGGGINAPNGVTVSYSIIEGGHAGTGNLNVDPLFSDPGAWDLRLSADSPAIDVGNNSAVPADVLVDADMSPRFGSPVDMGAYERATNRLIVTKFGRGTGTVSGGAIDCGVTCLAILPADTEVVLTATPDSGWQFTGWGGDCSGTEPCTVRVPAIVTARFGKVWYVNSFATGANDGTSWTNAFTDLQNAIAAAVSSDDIWVAAGTYKPHVSNPAVSFAMKNGAGIYGGFLGTETDRSQRDAATNVTTLSGDIGATDSYHVVTATQVERGAVLDGFTVTSGNASSGGDVFGGGILIQNSSPRIEHCTITGNNANFSGGGIGVESGGSPFIAGSNVNGNNAFYGAGIAVRAGVAVISGTEITGNTATYGGGVYAENSAPRITGSHVHTNTANGGGGGGIYGQNASMRILQTRVQSNTCNSCGGGGALLNGGTPYIANSVIAENTAAAYGGLSVQAAGTIVNTTIAANSGGGLQVFTPAPTLVNCILWGNTSYQISGSGASVTYSDVQGGFTGAGNIDSDPIFDDQYRIGAGSQAIDAGSNVAAASLSTDFEGKPRKLDAPVADTGIGTPPLVDMGAFEFYPVTITGPTPQSACAGTQATLSVTASGWGALTYVWRKATVPIGAPSSPSYTIPSVSASDQGSYDVVVTDSLGTTSTSSAAMLTVTTPPSIDVPPSSATKCPTQSVTFTVTASGSGLTYQWRKNLNPIDGATGASYQIASIVAGDAGSYDVVVSGSCTPPATSSAATLTVNTATSIDTQPSSVTVCAGQPANFSVAASGTNLTYQWRRGGENIDGANSPSYSIASAMTSQAGTYDVVVTGSCGSVTSNAVTLTVNAAPSIVNFNPLSGGTGTAVTIHGSGFTGATGVAFNGTNAPGFAVNSDSQITANVPPGATTGPITVMKGGCTTATSPSNFTVVAFGPPANLVAAAASATSIALSWTAAGGANHYQIFRGPGIGPYALIGTSVGASFLDSGLPANTSFLYVVRAVDAGGTPSADSNADIGTTVFFTDEPLQPGLTIIQTAHFTQLRTAVNAARAAAGLAAATFTDPSLGGVSVKAVHITELRDALDPARAALGLPALTYTDPTLNAGATTAKAAHVQELRNGV